MTELAPGSTIAGYRIERLERVASRASVYRAGQLALGRDVALYVADAPAGSAPADEFLDMARRLAVLDQPHVLSVYEAGEADGRVFATGQARPSRTVADVLAEDGAMPPARAAAVVAQVSSALRALEAAGIRGAATDPSSLLVAGESGDPRVLLAPLETAADETTPASESLSRLLDTLLAVAAGEGEAVLARAAALRRPRRRRRAAVAGAVLLACAMAAVILVAEGGDGRQPLRASVAPPDTPVAGIAARIPLGGAPLSVGAVAVGAGSVWVATDRGALLRVDPRANRVVGAPIRIGPRGDQVHVTVRVGEGSVWVAHELEGTLTRIDPASGRVLLRRHLRGDLSGLAVGGGEVAVTRTAPGPDGIVSSHLLRFDARSLRPLGRAVPVGRRPWSVEMARGAIWVTGYDGTVTRVDRRTGAATRIWAASSGVATQLLGQRLWITDLIGQTVTPVGTDPLGLPARVARVPRPTGLTAARGDIWVISVAFDDPAGPAYLLRLDPRSLRALGRRVALGRGAGWLVAGYGALWVGSGEGHALLRLAPSARRPAASGRAPDDRRRVLAPGPLAPGQWRSATFTVPFTVSVPDRSWLVGPPSAVQLQLLRSDADFTGVLVAAPSTFYTVANRIRRLTGPSQLMRALSADTRLRVTPTMRVALGGHPALTATVRVRTRRQYPSICEEACAPLFGFAGDTYVLGRSAHLRVTALRVNGRNVVVLEELPATRSFETTGAVARSLRFG